MDKWIVLFRDNGYYSGGWPYGRMKKKAEVEDEENENYEYYENDEIAE